MSLLLLADHDGKTVSDATKRALTAALQIDTDIAVLVAGQTCAAAAEDAAGLAGVGRVLVADAAGLAGQLAEPVAALVVDLAAGFSTILAPSTAAGRNVLPRVAALLDVMQVSDIIKVVAADTFERPIYAGGAVQTVRSRDAVRVVTVRTAAFPAAASGGRAPVEAVAAAAAGPTRFIGAELTVSARPELGAARVVVSGGRALQSKENFDRLILPLADALGAAVGASRAAVDAGYAPNDWQVGQTGKAVAPDLYIAVGISGAIQHLAGMKDAKVIVAINKDEEAPIFQVADYGLVADLYQAVPELIAALEKRGR
jgi:electron transfer flavoprotein alpha subunit